MRWFPPTGEWVGPRWYGPEQNGERTRASIASAYAFLLSVPYLSAEDKERLKEQCLVAMLKATK